MSVPTPQSRIAVLEARYQIRDLPPKYAFHVNSVNLPALVDLYSSEIDVPGYGTGREALLRKFAANRRSENPAALRLTVLQTGTHWIEFESADIAHGLVYSICDCLLQSGGFFRQAIRYADRYLNEDGRWVFASERAHELFYGVNLGERPNELPLAHWPQNQTGKGSLWKT
jgi:hypothetical protein